MRKLREVMRRRFELHLGYQQIGRSCAIGVSTVCKYLQRAEAEAEPLRTSCRSGGPIELSLKCGLCLRIGNLDTES